MDGVWHKSIHYHFTIYMRARKVTQEKITEKKYSYRRQAKKKRCVGDFGEFPIDHLLLTVYGGNSKRL